jgi:phosphoglycolate phosphatase-like HAD superfamily hydrolase
MRRIRFIAALAIAPAVWAADPLPSWIDTPRKKAITEMVARVTAPGPSFVPPAERVAVFDNDGTLWAEQPMYVQLFFAIDRVKSLAPQHPEWKGKEPFASLLEGDVQAALAGGEKAVLEIVEATHSGMTADEFQATVKDWLRTAKHPRFKRPFTDLAYQPMLELLVYLRANGFKTFIVSGGGIEFVRAFAEKLYGIPPEQVVGSVGKEKYEVRGGTPVVVKVQGIDHVDDGPGKPVGIVRFIGRRPIAAFGNSDGDLQMLEWTCFDGKGFCLYVRHTDGEREWAYDRRSSVGKLDKGLDAATARGWPIVDMKTDWRRVFAFEAR